MDHDIPWDFEDPMFEKWLEAQATAANAEIGKSTTNAPVWGTPGASHRYDTDRKIHAEFATAWENARDSQLFRQVVPRNILAGVDDEMSLPGHFLSFRRKWLVSALPAWERLRKHNTTEIYILYLVQSVPCGCPMPRRMISHPDYRKLVVLRDLVAVPNQLSPMLTYPAGHDKLSRYVLYPNGVAPRDSTLAIPKLVTTAAPSKTIQVASPVMGNKPGTGPFSLRKDSVSQLVKPSADQNDGASSIGPVCQPSTSPMLMVTLWPPKFRASADPLQPVPSRQQTRSSSENPVPSTGLTSSTGFHLVSKTPSAKEGTRSASVQPTPTFQLGSISSTKKGSTPSTRSTSLQPPSSTRHAGGITAEAVSSRPVLSSQNTKSAAARKTIGPSPLQQVSSSQTIESSVDTTKTAEPPTEQTARPDSAQCQFVFDVIVQVATVALATHVNREIISQSRPEFYQEGPGGVSQTNLIAVMGKELTDKLPPVLEAYQSAIHESKPWTNCREDLRHVLLEAVQQVFQRGPKSLAGPGGVAPAVQPPVKPAISQAVPCGTSAAIQPVSKPVTSQAVPGKTSAAIQPPLKPIPSLPDPAKASAATQPPLKSAPGLSGPSGGAATIRPPPLQPIPGLPLPQKDSRSATMSDLTQLWYVLQKVQKGSLESINNLQNAQKVADNARAVESRSIEVLQTKTAEHENRLCEQVAKHMEHTRNLTFLNQRMQGTDQGLLRHEAEIRNLAQKIGESLMHEAEVVATVNRQGALIHTGDEKAKGQDVTIKAQHDKIKSQEARLQAQEQKLAAQDQKIAEMMRMLEKRV